MMTSTSASQTRELILTALVQGPRDPDHFIRQNGVDPALAETITALLSIDEATPAAIQPQRSATDPPAVSPGDVIGPYIVVRPLGRGGMGEVFLAKDPRLDRQVALKCLITSKAAGHDLRARVIQEARAAARISHPAIAAVYDVLEHDGRAFIVMEYVEGESLAARISRGPIVAERVIDISRQLAGGLAAAHAAGVIHRDLKPANVQVRADGSVKILDFGVAMAMASLSSIAATGTMGTAEAPAVRAGTPVYMAPEHLLGRTVDERSDLFSMAVVLFEMATGRRPSPSNDPLEILVAAVRVLPRADTISPNVPASLADVIAKGLSANPTERYQTAAEMGAALDAVRAQLFPTGGVPVVVVPVSRGRRVAWALGGIALMPAILWALGRLTSAAYNQTMERTGAFGSDPAAVYIELGWRSILAPLVYGTLAAGALWLAPFLLRLLELSDVARRRLHSWRTATRLVGTRLALDDPLVFAQALVTLGVIAIAAVGWRFNALINAFATFISRDDPAGLWQLGPENISEKVLYRAALTVLFLTFAAGLWRVLHLRRRLGTHGGLGALVALIAIVASLLALNEIPYRLMWRSKAARVVYAGQRCSIIGAAGTRRLLYCPEGQPPHNKDVDAADPALGAPGVIEDVFARIAPR